VEDEAAAGGGVEALIQRGEADLALPELADHGDEVGQGAAVQRLKG
jgi:hypothetical protein